MIKSEALKWLVEKVTKWPTRSSGIVSTPPGWSWGKDTDGDVRLFRDIPTVMYVDCHIEQQEWLDGIGEALVEPMSSSEAFNWLYERYSKNLDDWPVVGVDCRTLPRPAGWSWFIPGKINQKYKLGTRAELAPPPQVDFGNITYEQIKRYVEHEKIDLTPTDGATKFDDDKPMMHLVPLISVEAVAKVMTFGAKKYAPNGWKSVPNAVDRYNSAILRHMVAIQKGEVIDPDSGLPHIDHIACNAMFLSYFHNVGESNE